MKKITFIIVLIILFTFQLKAQTKIGNNPTSINSNALLEMESTTKGLLISRMTAAQRNAIPISAAEAGLLVYQTDAPKGFYFYNGSLWINIADGVELDPVFAGSVAYGITVGDTTNWNMAYSWGNHAGLYRPIAWVPTWTDITSNPFSFTSLANNQLLRYNSATSKWENFTPSYLTSLTEADPIWIADSANYYTKANLQTSGHSSFHFNNLTNKPTTVGGYGITDAMTTAHAANSITNTNITNWNTAYGWGNHASAGYLTSLTGEVTSVGNATTITNNAVILGKIQQITTNSLLGRSSALTGNVEVLTVGSGLSLSGGVLTATGTGGTVTSVGVTTANGVSGIVTNPTTTPTISLTLGAITPTSVASTGAVTGSNLSGTNTGDNAVNSLYSGLITNATHTGDATGATALTVKGINGVLLSGLSTGILKNTTTTGVPSIAVAGTDYQVPITLGDVTTSGATATIGANKVTYSKIQTVAASRLLGNPTASAAVPSEISIGSGLNLSVGGALTATGTGGTVTSVGVTTANGVSGTVANPTTTPAISLTLGAITPTSVAATNGISGTQLTSTIATGTAPLVVTSTTPVANLSIGGNAATATSAISFTGSLAGDVTGTQSATVLSNSGVTAATYGSASQVPVFAVDTKGRVTSVTNTNIAIAQSAVTNLTANLAAKAPLASPALTGTPTAPTATAGTNTTQIATTAFVANAIAVPLVREVADQFSATASQTSFTLTQTPSVNSKVKMYINGIRISNTAYSISGTTLTYVPANNGGYALTAGDRVQFDYYY